MSDASVPIANARHERYAQLRFDGKSELDAYVGAGYTANDSNAARLNGNERIKSRIAWLQQQTAKKLVTTAADIVTQLAEDRTFARQHKHSAAAISATMGQAKVLGLLKDQVEHTGKDGAAIQVEEQVDVTIRTKYDRMRRLAHLLRTGQKRASEKPGG